MRVEHRAWLPGFFSDLQGWIFSLSSLLLVALGALLMELAKRVMTSPDRIHREALEMLEAGSRWRKDLEEEITTLRRQVDDLRAENDAQARLIADMQRTIARLERLACVVNCDDRRGVGE